MEIIIDSGTIATCQRLFKSRLAQYASQVVKATIGGPGFSTEQRVSYSSELGIWWVFSKGDNRYWNAFGIGDPRIANNSSVVCEINYPIAGYNGRVAAAFGRSQSGQIVLLHSGKLGGGRIGVGKSSFWRHYVGEPIDVQTENGIKVFAPLGALNHPRLPLQVALFIKEIDRIKNLVTSPNRGENLESIPASFSPEFSGRKQYKQPSSIEAICDHGLVVNSLRAILNDRGLDVANNQTTDLFVLSKKHISIVFEIKTDVDLQSLYTAVGQLLLNSPLHNQKPKLVLVLPDVPRKDLKNKLERLSIEVLKYSWRLNQPRFANIDHILK